MMTRWAQTEPVRLYLYGVLVPALLVAVGYGLITAEAAALWAALGAAALGVPAIESARSKVTPVARAEARINLALQGRPRG